MTAAGSLYSKGVFLSSFIALSPFNIQSNRPFFNYKKKAVPEWHSSRDLRKKNVITLRTL